MMIIDSYRFGGTTPTPLPFIFSVTVADGDSFLLPTVVGGSYDALVDWGDGNDNTLTTWNVDRSNTYTTAGTYDITISGEFDGFNFFDESTSRLLIREIKQWGIVRFLTGGSCFINCSNLTISATDAPDLTNVTSMFGFFNGCSSLTTIPGSSLWSFPSVTNMQALFKDATNFNADISAWDVSGVESFQEMFRSAINFNSNISSWSTTSATNMLRMFQSARTFNQDIGGWYTNNVPSFFGMFFDADAFDQDISGWVVTALTDATAMFGSGSSLSTVNYDLLLVGWEGQSVNNSVTLAMNNSEYTGGSAAATARAALISDHSWTISDGGIA